MPPSDNIGSDIWVANGRDTGLSTNSIVYYEIPKELANVTYLENVRFNKIDKNSTILTKFGVVDKTTSLSRNILFVTEHFDQLIWYRYMQFV